jgi:hypothetical protein
LAKVFSNMVPVHTHTDRYSFRDHFSSHLKAGFCGTSLYLQSIENHLNNPIPDLLTDIAPSTPNQIEDRVHVPSVVMIVA